MVIPPGVGDLGGELYSPECHNRLAKNVIDFLLCHNRAGCTLSGRIGQRQCCGAPAYSGHRTGKRLIERVEYRIMV